MFQNPAPQPHGKKLISQLKEEFQPSRLLPTLSAGLINGVLVIFFEISFAAMIFSGELSGYLSNGIGFLLFGAFVIGTVLALTSSYPGTVGIVQDAPAAVLGLVAVAIAANMPASALGKEIFFTTVAAIGVSTLLTGALFLVMWRFKLGNLIRFVPYPVVGGFLAGIGWLLIQGGIGVMTETTFNVSQFSQLFQSHVLIKWMPALIFAGLLLVISRRYNHFLIMPAMLLSAIGLFYLILFLTGTSLADAGSEGWLLGPFPEGPLWQPMTPSVLSQVNWEVVFGQIGSMGTIFIISVISLLLNASGLELIVRRDIDLNHELKSTGIANLFAGICGSPTGYIAISMSVLGHKMGSSSRLAGLSSAILCGIILFFGVSALSFLPKPVAGCMLLFIGLDFLYEWLHDGWFKLPKIDYFLMLLILVIIGNFGFLKGVAAGVIVAFMLFIVSYSRINVVKYALSGLNYQSAVHRAAPHRWLLKERGGQLHILKLHGYIFFGTSNNLLEQIRQRANDPELLPLRFIVLDFRLVTGFDSSALNSFEMMKQLAEKRNISLVFTHLSPAFRRQFERGGFIEEGDKVLKIFPDLDHSVEWCENQILMSQKATSSEKEEIQQKEQRDTIFESTFDDMMRSLKQEETFELLLNRMRNYLEPQKVPEGSHLINQGDPPGGLYFIETGQVTVKLEDKDGKIVRLRTIGTGSVVGEMGLYSGYPATASVVTNQPSMIYYLTEKKLKLMEENDPEIAADLHKFMAHLLGDRLVTLTNTMRALLDY